MGNCATVVYNVVSGFKVPLYSVDEIVGAINNYGLVFESDYFYDYRWSLANFLNKPNGIGRFLDTGDMWMNYYNNHCSYSEKLKRNGINIEDYID